MQVIGRPESQNLGWVSTLPFFCPSIKVAALIGLGICPVACLCFNPFGTMVQSTVPSEQISHDAGMTYPPLLLLVPRQSHVQRNRNQECPSRWEPNKMEPHLRSYRDWSESPEMECDSRNNHAGPYYQHQHPKTCNQPTKPWLGYDRMPLEAVKCVGVVLDLDPLPSSRSAVGIAGVETKDEVMAASSSSMNLLGDDTTHLVSTDPDYHRVVVSQGGDQGERKRAHMHPSWWLPEILAQVGGIICLVGKSTAFGPF